MAFQRHIIQLLWEENNFLMGQVWNANMSTDSTITIIGNKTSHVHTCGYENEIYIYNHVGSICRQQKPY